MSTGPSGPVKATVKERVQRGLSRYADLGGQVDSIAQLAQKYDTDNDGQFSLTEVRNIIGDFQAVHEERHVLRKILIALICMVGILLGVQYYVTRQIVLNSKEVKVNDDHVLRDQESGVAVMTEDPHTYVTIADLPQLPREALDSVQSVSFITEADGLAHRYRVAGYRFNEHEPRGMEVFFNLQGYSAIIGEDENILVIKGDTPDQDRRFVIAGPSTEQLGEARRRLRERHIRELPDSTLMDRCLEHGVCLHTKAEIYELHSLVDTTVYVGLEGGMRRYLAETSAQRVTYAELSMDSMTYATSDKVIKQVEEYVSSLNTTQEFSNQTSTISYTLYERCNNYALEQCGVAVPHNSDKEAVRNAAPYRGLEAVDGVWYFKDEIHYEEDQNIIKVAIRYAHDPLNADRRRVFVISKTDASQYVEYDEITHEDDFENVLRVDMMNCMTTPPDDVDEDAGTVTIDEDVPIEGETDGARRRHLAAEHARARLHRHLRTKIAGFGNIRRRLTIDEDGNEILDIDFESEEASSDNVHGVVAVDNSTFADDLKADDANHNETSWQAVYGNSTVHLQTDVPQTNDTAQEAAIAPKSFFGAPGMGILNETLSWPNFAECVAVAGFEDEIKERIDLDHDLYIGEVGGNATRRLSDSGPVTKAGQAFQRKLDVMVDAFERLERKKNDRALVVSQRQLRRRSISTHKRWQKKVRDRVRGYAREQMREIKNEVISSAKAEAFNVASSMVQRAYEYYYGDLPLTDQCAAMENEAIRFDGHIQFYVEGPMENINDNGEYALEKLEEAQELEDDLERIIDVFRVLDPVLGLMGFLPYVGPAFKLFRKACAYANRYTVQPAERNVARFNRKVEQYRLEDRIQYVVDTNAEAGEKLAEAKVWVQEQGHNILAVDRVCPNDPLRSACETSSDALRPVNDELDKVRDLMANFAAQIDLLAGYLVGIDILLENPIYIVVTDFFNAIYGVLRPFIDLLYRRIGVWVPVPGWAWKRVCWRIHYPCGVRWCRSRVWCGWSCRWRRSGWGWKLSCRSRYCNISYPCGVHWCSYWACMWVGYPTITWKYFSFRVVDIIMGALSVLNIVLDALMSLLKSLIPGLPELNFSFPGLPGMFDLSILTDIFDFSLPNIFPSLDFSWPVDIPLPYTCSRRLAYGPTF